MNGPKAVFAFELKLPKSKIMSKYVMGKQVIALHIDTIVHILTENLLYLML